jgi:hypothetical protein
MLILPSPIELIGMEWRKLVLGQLEWIGIEEVSVGPTGMDWSGGSYF